jgi:hypothetical protein
VRDPAKTFRGGIVSEQPLLIWIPAQLPVRVREPMIGIPPRKPVDLATLTRVRDGLVRLP